MRSVAALVGMVEADPLTNGDIGGREEEALEGAVSKFGLAEPEGIVSCDSAGYVDEEVEAELGAETGIGFMGDIHNDGGRLT